MKRVKLATAFEVDDGIAGEHDLALSMVEAEGVFHMTGGGDYMPLRGTRKQLPIL